MSTRVWILGASDPEMAAIEALLRDCGEEVVYAVGPDGQRVHPGNAYRAIGYRIGDTLDLHTRWEGAVYLVECGGDLPPDAEVIDHHRPGDPGYGRPPERFLEASSLGQVLTHLFRLGSVTDAIDLARRLGWTTTQDDGNSYGSRGIYGCRLCLYGGSHGDDGDESSVWSTIPAEVVLAAAADHCLESAYRGRCPGVDPDDLMRWRAASRAAFQGRTVDAVLADVEAARKRLRDAMTASQNMFYADESGQSHHCPDWATVVADLRGESIPELPEAAAREGIAFLADQTDRDGRKKVVLMAAPPELVRRFLAGDIVPGLVDVYGDPARGFAGGYVA